MEILLAAILFALILKNEGSAELDAHFAPTTCISCPMGIRWSKSQHTWVHDNGNVFEPLPGQYPIEGIGLSMHRALP